MTTGTASRPAAPSADHRAAVPSVASVVVAGAVRQVRRGTLVVAVIAGGLAAIVVTQYRGLEGAIALSSLSALADNPAIRTLFGPPVALEDPGGFTVWRTGTVLAVLVGVWAVLTATRLTRGEEEAGRWDLLLAGRITLRSLVVRTLAVLLCAAAVPGAAVAVALLLTGRCPPGHCSSVPDRRRGHDRRGARGRRGPVVVRAPRGLRLATAVLLAGPLRQMVADAVPASAGCSGARRSGSSAASHRSRRTASCRWSCWPVWWRRWAASPSRSPRAGTSAAGGCVAGTGSTRRAGCSARCRGWPST